MNENFNVSMLYNPEVKAHFLEDYDIQDATKRVYYNNLKLISKIEFEKKKDLYEMTDDEVEEVLSATMKPTPAALNSLISNLRNYIEWCDGKYINRSFPLFADTPTRELIEKYIAKSKINFYTREELFDVLDHFVNPMDKYLFLALFEGINGKSHSELFNMKLEHLQEKDDKFYVNLYDSEQPKETSNYEISKELYDLAILSESTSNYVSFAKESSLFDLQKNGYIMRKRISSKINDDRVGYNFIVNNMKYYKEIFNNDNLKLSYILQSGIMHYLYELIKDQGGEIKTVTKKHLQMISDRFRYGTYIHSETLDLTYSYSVIKRSINKEWFENKYCKFEYSMK